VARDAIQDPQTADPKEKAPKPEYPQKAQRPPGSDAGMTPKADHGEDSYRGLGRLKDRIALVTGGDSGIGRAVSLAFAREGADVAIGYLPAEEADADETVRWITKAGRRALKLPGDIRDERHCTEMIERVFDEFGTLDILVNNAAMQRTHERIEDFSTDEFDDIDPCSDFIALVGQGSFFLALACGHNDARNNLRLVFTESRESEGNFASIQVSDENIVSGDVVAIGRLVLLDDFGECISKANALRGVHSSVR